MKRLFTAATALVLLAAAGSTPASNRIPLTPPAAQPAARPLPEAPEKALVLQYCNECHTLDWIQRSGGTEAGWTDRLKRMIRAGAKIPRSDIPSVAAYLAKALPARPAPPSPEP